MSRGRMSIKVRVEVLTGGSSQLSFDRLGVLVDVCREESADEWMLLSIDVDLFSLQIVCSKSADRLGVGSIRLHSSIFGNLEGFPLSEVFHFLEGSSVPETEFRVLSSGDLERSLIGDSRVWVLPGGRRK
ncbi:hypothetical protein F2Q69_00029093 [Brassica cretica]|uniref:Uncharacterized protein n=1 Tax=Brassica cretica TaxID=69181 RepID=A0A8S9RSQ5_BRACR|nr:hypothetical protein F2Q69_00029093 [Brassica cretica]